MPGRYPSSSCSRCQKDDQRNTPETTPHRYCHCSLVSGAWEWLKTVLLLLDSSLSLVSDSELLSLNFEKGMRENAVVWIIGSYIEIVENEVVTKENFLSIPSITGQLKQKKQSARYQALPELGIIAGVDFDQQGVG